MTLQKLIRFFIDKLYFIYSHLTYPLIICSKPSKKKKKVLLIAHRALMADYIAEIPELLKEDKRIEFHLLRYFLHDRKNSKSYINKLLPFQTINRFVAYLKRWDLIIVSSFQQRHLVNNKRCPTLFIEHGIAAGGIRDKQLFFLGPTIYRNMREGDIRFSSIFVSSQYNKQRAIKIDKNLEKHVKVVGFYNHDKLLLLQNNRDNIREDMGFDKSDKVVFTLSSWGPNCLFNQMGDAYLNQARKCMDEFKFIINVHPMEHRTTNDGKKIWGEYLKTQTRHGFIVRNPHEDWKNHMIAADIIVSDFSSMGLNAVVINKPIVFSPFSENSVAHDGLIWMLRKMSPILNEEASNLRELLNNSLMNYSPGIYKDISLKINSELNNAKKLYKHEIYNLLNLN